ncbi:MAG: N-acetyl-D-Glu racemase DgcA [Gammaproteobacteria bacterium]
MKLKLRARQHSWALREPFVISRGTQTDADVILVQIEGGGRIGHGEAMGVDYHGETTQGLLAQIEAARPAIEAGIDRRELLTLLPNGGARNAIDAALWDLEAKLSGISVWQRAGIAAKPVATNVTIGIRSIEASAQRALELADHPWIKVKVAADRIVATVEAVRAAAPRSHLVVDANQAWTLATLREVTPDLLRLKVDLIEQPVRVGTEEALEGYQSPIPLCADESLDEPSDLAKLVGRFQFVNIKLDKTGGLTAALDLADQAQAAGLKLMVGCMLGSSLAMAPGMVLAQRCQVVDLDGPLLQSEDCANGIVYERGTMMPFSSALWG